MDEPSESEEFVVGDSFARILTETTQSLVCVLRPRRPDPALQRGVRARDGVHARGGDRAATRATSSSRPRSARRSASSSTYVWSARHVQPAGRPLADEGRRAAAHRVVEPADGRRRRQPGSRSSRRASTSPTASRARRVGRVGAAGRPGGQARGDQPPGHRAARAAARRDARRLGGQPGAGLHGGLRGVRARAGGQRLGRRALRGGRHGDDRRAPQPRRHRRLPARRAVLSAEIALGARAGASSRRRPRAWTTGACSPARWRSAMFRGGYRSTAAGADRRGRGAVGRGRDRQRGPAARRRPRTASAPSASWCRWRSRARRRARTSSPRARGSSRPATSSAGGSSATSTTARSSASSRSR